MTIDMKTLVSIYNSKQYNDIYVRSMNTTTNTTEYKKVTNAWLTHQSAEVIKITDTTTGKTLTCTPDHKIWTHNRGYVNAEDLCDTDILQID